MTLPGPPPIKPFTGRAELQASHPHYQPVLDHGAFRVVWELVEAQAKRTSGTAAAEALQRAVEALREEYWAKHQLEPSVRRIPRRKGVR